MNEKPKTNLKPAWEGRIPEPPVRAPEAVFAMRALYRRPRVVNSPKPAVKPYQSMAPQQLLRR